MKDDQFDMTLQRQVMEHAAYLKRQHAKRNAMFDVMEDMYLLTWDDEERIKRTMENVKLTKSPNARNALQGAIRLLIATDPVFSVPHEANDQAAADGSDRLEKMANTMWSCAGRLRGDPVHYDVVLSMLLFSEVHIPVTRTADLVEHAKGGSPAAVARAEEMADITPYTFDVWDPRTGYPDIGPLGLTAYYREVLTTSGAVMDEFGEDGKRALKGHANRYETVTLCHFWDFEHRLIWVSGSDRPLIWVSGSDRPLLQEKHGLPFIPITVQLGEGSRLFSMVEDWRQPFLYTLWKSGLWNRQNLALTVLYTMVNGIGNNPMWVYQATDENNELSMDFSRPGGIVKIRPGESLQPMAKNAIDPSLLQGWEIATSLGEQSTIYGATLGEPITSGNASFSMVSLLHQAGRLPLLVSQRKAGWGIADAVKTAFKWMRFDGGKSRAGYGDVAELAPADIPRRFELDCKLDVSLPQDKLQMANIANIVSGGDDPIASKRWARENVLSIGQSDAMTKEIWEERVGSLLYQKYIQEMMQAPTPQGNTPVLGPSQQPPVVGPGQMMPTPELQGLPPEMAMGGGQPPEMEGGM